MLAHLLFSFNGRIRRSQWWLSRLIILGMVFVAFLALVAVVSVTGENPGPAVELPIGLLGLAGFGVWLWMDLATGVKRLHDQGWTGWLSLVLFVPGIGSLFGLIALGCLDSSQGTNAYGPSEKYPSRDRMAAVFD